MKDMKISQIAQGINLHLNTTRKFKTNVVCVLIRRPLRCDEVTVNTLISMILTMGCAKYNTAAKLAAQTERMYGAACSSQVVKKGEEQIIQIFLEYLPRGSGKIGITTADALEFIGDVILHPLVIDGGFDPDITQGEKRTLHAQISARKNHKAEYVRYRLLEEMCSSEPFAIPGDGYAEDLEAITPTSAYRHYRRILQISPIEVMIIGDETEQGCVEILRNMFCSIQDTDAEQRHIAEREAFPRPLCRRASPKKINEHTTANQGNIAIGYRGDVSPVGDQAYALLLANEVFGGYGSSRLFSVIREQESLAYAVSSTVYRLKSIIAVHAGVDPNNFDRVAQLVNDQLEHVAQGQTSNDDFENAKKSLLKKYEAVKDYHGQMLDFYMMQHMLGCAEGLDGVMRKIRNLKSDELASVFNKIGLDTQYTLSNL